jgi:hypothetical protein
LIPEVEEVLCVEHTREVRDLFIGEPLEKSEGSLTAEGRVVEEMLDP